MAVLKKGVDQGLTSRTWTAVAHSVTGASHPESGANARRGLTPVRPHQLGAKNPQMLVQRVVAIQEGEGRR